MNLDGDIIGDPMESAAMQAINWSYTKSETAINKGKSVQIIHRFHFSSELKRMCTIALAESNK